MIYSGTYSYNNMVKILNTHLRDQMYFIKYTRGIIKTFKFIFHFEKAFYSTILI